jgi:opacity protein-like surface antigen
MGNHRARYLAVLAGLGLVVAGAVQPVGADLSAFVGYVGFGKVNEAKLSGSPGFGVRWGKSTRMIGGETSLMFARPERKVSLSDFNVADVKGTGTAIFYEARLIVNIPFGMIKPFADAGFGQIIVTSTQAATDTIPTSVAGVPLPNQGNIQAANQALKAVSDLQQNTAFSYGLGARYPVTSRLDVRLDLRQYAVFSVKGFLIDKAAEQVAQATSGLVPSAREKTSTTLYKEISLGLTAKF